MLFKSFSLGKQVSVIGTVLGGCDPEALNVTSNGEEVVLLLLQANLTVTDLHRNVSVASFLEVYLLSQVVVLGGYALVVAAKSSVFSAELGVLFSDTSEFSFGILKSQLLVAEVGAAAIKKLLCVLDASLCARKLKVKGLELVGLAGGLS